METNKIRYLILLGIIGTMVLLALCTFPYDNVESLNPLNWISEMIEDILDFFFGWSK